MRGLHILILTFRLNSCRGLSSIEVVFLRGRLASVCSIRFLPYKLIWSLVHWSEVIRLYDALFNCTVIVLYVNRWHTARYFCPHADNCGLLVLSVISNYEFLAFHIEDDISQGFFLLIFFFLFSTLGKTFTIHSTWNTHKVVQVSVFLKAERINICFKFPKFIITVGFRRTFRIYT